MSASEADSKIDLLEPEAQVKNKLKKVFCEVGNIEKNPLLDWISGVFFIIYEGAHLSCWAMLLLSVPLLPGPFPSSMVAKRIGTQSLMPPPPCPPFPPRAALGNSCWHFIHRVPDPAAGHGRSRVHRFRILATGLQGRQDPPR